MVRTQIQLTEEQYQRLKDLATASNASLSELIRRSVDQLITSSKGASLSERRKRAIAIAGRFHSGHPGEMVSADHDIHLVDSFSS